MQKKGVLTCPACQSDVVEKFSKDAAREFRCKECGMIFGTSNVNTPDITHLKDPSDDSVK